MTDLVPVPDGALITPAAAERLAGVLAAFWSALESEDTRRAYREDWTRFSRFLRERGNDPLVAGPVELAAYFESLRSRRLARSTRSRALSVLRQVYGAIYRAELRRDNPARELKPPRTHREPRTPWLIEVEIVAILRPWADTWVARRNRLVLLFLVGVALRRRSAAGVRVDDLVRRTDGRLGLRVRAKGGKQAEVLLPEWLAIEIASWIEFSGVSGPLFPRLRRAGYDHVRPEMDRAIGPDKVRDIVKEAARRAGIDKKRATPHALRRSFVTICRMRGAGLADLQMALLHSDPRTTEGYDRAIRTMANAPGEMLRDLVEASADPNRVPRR